MKNRQTFIFFVDTSPKAGLKNFIFVEISKLSKFTVVVSKLVMSCNLSPNFCDNYCVVLNEREILTQQCLERKQAIEEREIGAIDDRKLETKLKFQAIYAEYTKQLKDKVGVLKMIAQSLLEEHLRSQAENSEIEEVIRLQSAAINKLEKENKIIESAVNEEISEIRTNFSEKWIKLDEARRRCETSKIELEDLCKTENDLEKKIAEKRRKRKQVLCAIKAAKVQPKEEVTQKKFDKLQQSHMKMSKMLKETEAAVECFREKICQTQREMAVIRSFSKQQFEIVKQHDEWAMEMLSRRKKALEDDFFATTQGIQTFEAGNLQLEVCMSVRNLENLKETAEKLKCLTQKAATDTSTCKKIIKPSMKGKPMLKKPKKTLGTDYLGSNFVGNEMI